jgi:gliding motility-associated-like protein
VASDNGCPVPRRDTLLVLVELAPEPDAQPPLVSTTLPENRATVKAGQTVTFDVTATSPAGKYVSLRGVGRGFDLAAMGMQFGEGSGMGTVTKSFSWTPPCNLKGQAEGYTVDFIAEAGTCSPDRFDTLTVLLQVESLEQLIASFLPPNVFTPDGDGYNDFFEIPNLPADNCQYVFRQVEIYNRWGKVVFESKDREFRWSGQGFPYGVYYYLIHYSASTYKGTVSLLR